MIKTLFKALALLVLVGALAVVLAWWWFLRADAMTPPSLPGVLHTGSLDHDGHVRSWSAYIPASLATAPPLVLVMHGSRGSGEVMRTGTRFGFDVLAERHGFIAVYPDGYEEHWNDCRASASYSANTQNIDDVGFLRALVQRMVDEQGVDPSRVYATGLSNGGHMSYRLALEAPDLVAGIAAMGASLPVAASNDCTASGTAVAAMVMNGTLDPVNPYYGGVVEIFGDKSRGVVMSSADTAAYWAGLAGYTGKGQRIDWPQRDMDDQTSVSSEEWSAPGKVPVSLVTIVGGGHTVPHPVFDLPRILGPTSHQLDGPEVIWDFFSSAEKAPR